MRPRAACIDQRQNDLDLLPHLMSRFRSGTPRRAPRYARSRHVGLRGQNVADWITRKGLHRSLHMMLGPTKSEIRVGPSGIPLHRLGSYTRTRLTSNLADNRKPHRLNHFDDRLHIGVGLSHRQGYLVGPLVDGYMLHERPGINLISYRVRCRHSATAAGEEHILSQPSDGEDHRHFTGR
jgi:hypothetical protein